MAVFLQREAPKVTRGWLGPFRGTRGLATKKDLLHGRATRGWLSDFHVNRRKSSKNWHILIENVTYSAFYAHSSSPGKCSFEHGQLDLSRSSRKLAATTDEPASIREKEEGARPCVCLA